MNSRKSSELLIATGNEGKITELREMLAEFPLYILSLSDFPEAIDVAETGDTFCENALLKARGYARQTALIALADDSGLEVAGLDGRPGVLSARYGGAAMPFSEKMKKLLNELAESGDTTRRARFVCSIVVAAPDGEILCRADGICDGLIADEPRGVGGFGYDPIFIPDGFDKTFGELSADVKREISHRGRAFSHIIQFLRDYYGELT